jgi:hypothetical protein
MYAENEYMTSSEQLVAFLDGELPADETTTLFYELAQNPELQEEMRQYVQIRNTFRNSQLVPPALLKNNILKNTGLIEGPTSALLDSSSKVAAMLVALFFNRTSMSVIVVALLSVGAMYMMNKSSNPDDSRILSSNITKNGVANQSKSNIPVISSAEVSDKSNNNVSSDSKLFSDSKNSDNNSNLGKFNSGNGYSNSKKSGNISGNNSASRNEQTTDFNSLSALNQEEEIDNRNIFVVSNSKFLTNNFSPFVINQNIHSSRLRGTSGDLFSTIMQNTQLNIKKHGAASSPNFNLEQESNPIINDLSVEIKYNLNTNHSIGLVYGLENFRMTFDKDVDGIIYRYNQSWNAGWVAVNYHYNIGEISNTGLRPEFNLMAGATSVGPLFRGGVAMNYFITDNFYLNGGFESVLLAYQESQGKSGSQWFSTTKFGWTFGFGVGF